MPDNIRTVYRAIEYIRGRTGKAAARGNLGESKCRPHLVGAMQWRKRAGAKGKEDKARSNSFIRY